jgi:hypothetical protein
MKWLATWIMNWIVGDGSSEWAMAMRSEFDELQSGHLGWAVGCIMASTIQHIRQNWFFLAAVILAAYLVVEWYGMLLFYIATYDREFLIENAYKLSILGHVPSAFLLGYWKPDRALSIAIIGGFIGCGVGGAFSAMYHLGGSFYSWVVDAMWMDTLPAYAGFVAVLGIWFAAAKVGGRLREWQRRRSLS